MPNVKCLRIFAFGIGGFVLPGIVMAGLCKEPSAPDAWRIPASAFTAAAATRELEKLKGLLGPNGVVVDAVAWETSFVYIEGWLLKRQALEAVKRGEPDPYVADFCLFLAERAYVHH